MSKTNLDKGTKHKQDRELRDKELEAVSGGLLSNVLRMLEDTNKAIIGNIR
jgi:bacteriocin-like protein